MKVYIHSAACISPQHTLESTPLLQDVSWYSDNILNAIEPDYKKYIDPKLIRRMSRIIRMGVAAASQCLQDANNMKPDAIVTGTAYGCLEDTGLFLSRMIEQKEQMLSPTAFIQSTHNTVGAQIALMLQCTGYNNTFVHRGFSFESALLDSIMLIAEKQAGTVLVGSADELTPASRDILKRFGLFKTEQINSRSLLESNSKGSLPGEGTAFFLLSDKPTSNCFCTLDGIFTLYKPTHNDQVLTFIQNSLNGIGVDLNEIDLVITGRNGDHEEGKSYDSTENEVFQNVPVACYKHLSGEYPTSVSFAMWLAVKIFEQGNVPEVLLLKNKQGNNPKKILIYNQYQQSHHSLILLSKHS